MSGKENGLEQVRLYSKLCNPEQKAPSSAAWPFKPGDDVLVQLGPDYDDFLVGVVTRLLPPGRVAVRTPRGLVVRVAASTVRRI